jgi:hypothetical protein
MNFYFYLFGMSHFYYFLIKGDIGTMASVIHWELSQLPHSSVHWYVGS